MRKEKKLREEQRNISKFWCIWNKSKIVNDKTNKKNNTKNKNKIYKREGFKRCEENLIISRKMSNSVHTKRMKWANGWIQQTNEDVKEIEQEPWMDLKNFTYQRKSEEKIGKRVQTEFTSFHDSMIIFFKFIYISLYNIYIYFSNSFSYVHAFSNHAVRDVAVVTSYDYN